MATNNATNNIPSTPVSVANGGTGDTSFTAYSVICGGTTTTGVLQNVSGIGSSTQVLTSSGSGLPSWSSAPSGSLVLLLTQTASSSASLSFNSTYITSTYSTYVVIISGINNASGSSILNMDWSINNGSTYLNSAYSSGNNSNAYNSATLNNGNSSTTNPLIPSLTNASVVLSGTLFITLPQSLTASFTGQLFVPDSTVSNSWAYGYNSGTTTINNIKFSYSSGNITSGTISLYGVAQ